MYIDCGCFASQGDFGKFWRHFQLSQGGGAAVLLTFSQWMPAKGVAKHPIMQRTSSTTKNYLVQYINSAQAGKSWCGYEVCKGSKNF